MQFTYKDKYAATDIKSLLKEVFHDTGSIPDYDLVLCNGIKWDDPTSHFANSLDIPIAQYKLQLDFIMNDLQSQKKDSELAIARLQKNTKPNVLKTLLKRLLNEEPTKQVTEIVKDQKALQLDREKIKKQLH
jgi:hypothetical protein